MRGLDGGESDNPGCFLEIVPRKRIVCTSMLTGGWRPASPWLAMTAVFTLADEGSGTRYIARCLHKDDADYEGHSLAMLNRIAAAVERRVEMRFVPRRRRLQPA